ncbi:MAG: hypothetical protein K9J13_14205 [Saprospiraceae bacterium]|nr:hypothetical protein [Saprospiraceae bacterium]
MKKKPIIYLIIPILFLACANDENKTTLSVLNFNSGYSLYQDTIFVDVKGEMTHALKHQDKFYVLFQQRVLKYGGYEKRWLYIFSNGQLEKVIDCPKEMRTVYLDFYEKNDSLILKPYMDKQSYYLNLKNYCWTKIDKTDDLIFEDDKFLVYSMDFGEWGGKTWFKEKKTGQEYILEVTTPLVNKIDSTYYLTNSFRVLKIENPQLLNKCSDDITYENIESTGKSFSWYGKPIGFDIVYQDTTIDYFDFNYNPHIVSSFVLDNELLHIYETDTATYIARHKSYSIEPIQKIVDNISFYNWYYSYRCSNLKGNNELLKFRTGKEKMFGLLEMIDHEIHIKYIVNKALLEPRLVGAERADSIFVNRLKTILPQFTNLDLSKIDSKEKSWGSFDITPNHNITIGITPNSNIYTIDTCRSYLVKEDSIFSNSIMYYGIKDSNLVRVVSIDWDYERNQMNPESEKRAKKIFDNKAEFLIDYISNNIGKQTENRDEKDFVKRTWETPSGIILSLTYNKKYYGVGLVIYGK